VPVFYLLFLKQLIINKFNLVDTLIDWIQSYYSIGGKIFYYKNKYVANPLINYVQNIQPKFIGYSKYLKLDVNLGGKDKPKFIKFQEEVSKNKSVTHFVTKTKDLGIETDYEKAHETHHPSIIDSITIGGAGLKTSIKRDSINIDPDKRESYIVISKSGEMYSNTVHNNFIRRSPTVLAYNSIILNETIPPQYRTSYLDHFGKSYVWSQEKELEIKKINVQVQNIMYKIFPKNLFEFKTLYIKNKIEIDLVLFLTISTEEEILQHFIPITNEYILQLKDEKIVLY